MTSLVKPLKGVFDSVVLYIIGKHSGLEVGITEIYLAAESSSGYRI